MFVEPRWLRLSLLMENPPEKAAVNGGTITDMTKPTDDSSDSNEHDLKRWFFVLVAVSVGTQAVFSGARMLVSYRILEFGGNATTIGVFTAAFSLVPLLVAVAAGKRADAGAAPTLMRIGLVTTVLSALMIALSPDLIILLLGYVLMGFALLVTLIAAQGMVAHLRGSTAGLDSLFAYFTLGVSLGQFAGILISGAVAASGQDQVGSVDTTPALLALTALGLLVLIPGWFNATAYRRFLPPPSDTSTPEPHIGVGALLKEKGMGTAMFASITVIVGIDLMIAYMPLIGRELGLSVAVVTMILSARSGAAVVARGFMPMILKNLPRNRVLVGSSVIGAVSMLAMGAAPWFGGPVNLFIGSAICGFTWGMLMPMTMTWVSQLAPEQDRALALSVRLTGNRLAQVAIPPVAGLLAAATGSASVFLMAGGMAVIATVGTTAAVRNGTVDGAGKDPE